MLINEFYGNREVFITGATGFLGKGLIEKLLHDCPQIKVIYVMLRAKKSLSPEQRLEQFKKDKVFERIHQQCPEVLNKLHVIQGDSAELGLDISPSDLSLLQNVSIIFHMAANVRFDEPFRSSILLNTRATYELVKIAENLKNLVVLMHCSTAYCNPHEDIVEEMVYEMPVEWRTVIKIAETYDEETLNCLFNKFTDFYPNTYTFTKNLSEQLIKEYSKHMPMFIFRPSVVSSAYKEPAPGWNDNLYGPVGSMIGLSIGVIPIAICNAGITLDAVPLDVVTNLTIVAAYKRGMQHIRKESIPNGLEVVNCSSADIFNINFNGFWGIYEEELRANPMENAIWHYGLPSTTGCYYNFLFHMFLMSIPLGIVVDTMSLLSGRKMMMVKMSRRIVYTMKAILYFSSKQYRLINKNMIDLQEYIPQSEFSIYGSKDCYSMDYHDYFRNFLSGIKYFIFNQPRKVTPAALKRAKILYILSRTIKTFTITMLIVYLWSIVSKF